MSGDENIVFRDYSLRKRNPTKSGSDDDKNSKDKKKKDKEESKLSCLEISIDEPINQLEWQNLAEVINMCQGLGWFQVLPVGQKSSQPLQFNVLHVLPQANLPFASLPIEDYIKTYVSTERKTERRNVKVEGNLTPEYQERL